MVLKQSVFDELFTQRDQVGEVDPEHLDGRPADGCAADEQTAFEAEMVVPLVPSRVIKRCQLTSNLTRTVRQPVVAPVASRRHPRR